MKISEIEELSIEKIRNKTKKRTIYFFEHYLNTILCGLETPANEQDL